MSFDSRFFENNLRGTVRYKIFNISPQLAKVGASLVFLIHVHVYVKAGIFELLDDIFENRNGLVGLAIFDVSFGKFEAFHRGVVSERMIDSIYFVFVLLFVFRTVSISTRTPI